jgi:hypothetical protein
VLLANFLLWFCNSLWSVAWLLDASAPYIVQTLPECRSVLSLESVSRKPETLFLSLPGICKVGGVQSRSANAHLGNSIHLAEVSEGKRPPCFTDVLHIGKSFV